MLKNQNSSSPLLNSYYYHKNQIKSKSCKILNKDPIVPCIFPVSIDLNPLKKCRNCKLSTWRSEPTLISTAMVANGTHNDFVYLSNSNDYDFEESFQTIPDDSSEIFDPSPE